MKRRTKVIALATSLLVGVSMIGVGFASWVISNNEQVTATGNVKAESVSDNSVKFTASCSDSIVFGSSSASTSGWLTNDAANEALTATITLSFEGHGTLSKLEIGESYEYAGTSSNDGESEGWDFESAIDDGYISGPTYAITGYSGDFSSSNITLSAGSFTITGGSIALTQTSTLTITVTYAWGEAFNEENPYVFFNSQDYGKQMSDYASAKTTFAAWDGYDEVEEDYNYEYAKEALENLYTLIGESDGTTFKFTFTANAN